MTWDLGVCRRSLYEMVKGECERRLSLLTDRYSLKSVI